MDESGTTPSHSRRLRGKIRDRINRLPDNPLTRISLPCYACTFHWHTLDCYEFGDGYHHAHHRPGLWKEPWGELYYPPPQPRQQLHCCKFSMSTCIFFLHWRSTKAFFDEPIPNPFFFASSFSFQQKYSTRQEHRHKETTASPGTGETLSKPSSTSSSSPPVSSSSSRSTRSAVTPKLKSPRRLAITVSGRSPSRLSAAHCVRLG